MLSNRRPNVESQYSSGIPAGGVDGDPLATVTSPEINALWIVFAAVTELFPSREFRERRPSIPFVLRPVALGTTPVQVVVVISSCPAVGGIWLEMVLVEALPAPNLGLVPEAVCTKAFEIFASPLAKSAVRFR
jgi:hypothetical protein